MDLIEIPEKITIPQNWDYDPSVEKFKNLYKEVREKGAEALKEIKIAHEVLSKDSKKKKGRKFPNKTFETYCNDIGITKQTAYLWFHKYFPNYLPPIVKNLTIPDYTPSISYEEFRIILKKYCDFIPAEKYAQCYTELFYRDISKPIPN